MSQNMKIQPEVMIKNPKAQKLRIQLKTINVDGDVKINHGESIETTLKHSDRSNENNFYTLKHTYKHSKTANSSIKNSNKNRTPNKSICDQIFESEQSQLSLTDLNE